MHRNLRAIARASLIQLLWLPVLFGTPLEEDNCYTYGQCSTHPPTGATNQQNYSKGTKLDTNHAAAVDQAIALLEQWEEHCNVRLDEDPNAPELPGEDGGPGGDKPSEKLREAQANGSICAETVDWGENQPYAQTSFDQEEVDAVEPTENQGWMSQPCQQSDGAGVNLDPDIIPEQQTDSDGNPVTHEGEDGEELPSFDPAALAKLAGILLHESYHLNFPGTVGGDFNENETKAYQEAAGEYCKVAGCDHESVTQEVKDAMCEMITEANGNLCMNQAEKVCCAACEGDGVPTPPCEPCDPPPGEDEPGDASDNLGGIGDLNETVFSGGMPTALVFSSGFVHMTVDGANGTQAVSLDLSAAGRNVIPLSVATLGSTAFIVSGYDLDNDMGLLYHVQCQLNPVSAEAYLVHEGYEMTRPRSLKKIPGTLSYEFLDAPSGKVMNYDFRNGAFATVAEFGDLEDHGDYEAFYKTQSRGPTGRLRTAYTITKGETPRRATASGEFVLFVDEDGDGTLELRIP